MEQDGHVDTVLDSWLNAAGELAYTVDAATGQMTWHGDVQSVLGDINHQNLTNVEDFNRLVLPQDLSEKLHQQSFARAEIVAKPKSYSCEYRIKRPSGKTVWVEDRGAISFDLTTGEPVIRGLMASSGECRDGKRVLEQFTLYDALTGFHNRTSLTQILDHALRLTKTTGVEGGFMAIGIDRLSLFNEAYGADVTDTVICRVGERLDSLIGSTAAIGRVGGDVFGLVLPGADQAALESLAQKILSSLRMAPIETPAGPLRISVSMGGACFPQDAQIATDVMTKAETALQAAKKQGRGCYLPYNMSENQRQEFRGWLRTGDNFLLALDGNRLALAFQPIINTQNGDVAFHECLVRMIGANGSVMDACDFVPVIERLGLARLVDQYTTRIAVEELQKYPNLKLSVNVSAGTLTNPVWLEDLQVLLRKTPDIAPRLVVEITETLAMHDLEKSTRFVRALQALGCRVALDDFGVGNTSFSQIKALGVDIIKIDRSFVQNLSHDQDSQLIVRALQDLASGFNVETVGEGAETMAEVGLLRDDGVNFVQGYAYGLPSLERLWLPENHAQRRQVRALDLTPELFDMPAPGESIN